MRWDTGRVQSAQTTHVPYAGERLQSRERCFWMVEVWDETGASVTSYAASWTMGLLHLSDWSAEWIAANPEILRRDPDATEPTLTESGTPAIFRRVFGAS